MWLVQTVTVLSFTFTFPFFPLFFKELGIDDPGRAAFITGISGWALGIGLGIFSPIWGAVADRYGKKSIKEIKTKQVVEKHRKRQARKK